LLQSTALSDYDWVKAQRADPCISKVLALVRSGQRPKAQLVESEHIDRRFLRDWDKLVIEDDILFRHASVDGQNWKQLVLPKELQDIVFRSYHDDLGHQGRDRTLSLLKRRFFWPGMESAVENQIKQCGRCIRRKISPTKAAELVSIISTAPMELVCIDYLSLERSKGGYENILVITDHFSRYAQAIPTRNQTARTTARVLFDNFFVHYGFPAKLHSDKGANFESMVIRRLCNITGMRKSRTTPYHPMGNGMVERFNKTLLNMLGTLNYKQKSDWKSHVPTLCHAYNAATHDSTGYVPFFLMFGRHPRLAVDAFLGLRPAEHQVSSHDDYAKKLKSRLAFAYEAATNEARKNAARHKFRYDLQVRNAALEPGDRVLVRNVGLRGKNKLADQWEHSPYIVKKQPIDGIPVFEVTKENSPGAKPRLLHRNLLLPFMGLPCQDACSKTEPCMQEDQQRTQKSEPQRSLTSEESCSSSDSDDDTNSSPGEASTTAKYVIPMRRSKGQTGLLPRSEPITDSSEDQRLRPLRRGTRQRRQPERFQAVQRVTDEYVFEVPADQVVYI
ncbi:MAG: DDE-type integrase/transposase/recombinase, partial [Candidatus Thiodiazotropha sp.]